MSFKFQKYALTPKSLMMQGEGHESEHHEKSAAHEQTVTLGVAKLCKEDQEHVDLHEEDCNSLEHIEKFMKKHHFHIIDYINETKGHGQSVKCDMVYVRNYCGLRAIVILDKVHDCTVRRTTHGGSLFEGKIHSSRRLGVQVKQMAEKIKCKDIAYVCADGICLFTETDGKKDSMIELHKIEEGHRACDNELVYARYKKMYLPIVKYSDLHVDPDYVNEMIRKKTEEILAARHTDVSRELTRAEELISCAYEEVKKLRHAYASNMGYLDKSYERLYNHYGSESCDKYGTRAALCYRADQLLKCLDSIGDYDHHLENVHAFTEIMSANLNACNLCVSECEAHGLKHGLRM